MNRLEKSDTKIKKKRKVFLHYIFINKYQKRLLPFTFEI